MPLTLFFGSILRSLTAFDLSSFQNESSLEVSISSILAPAAESAVLACAALPGLAYSWWLASPTRVAVVMSSAWRQVENVYFFSV